MGKENAIKTSISAIIILTGMAISGCTSIGKITNMGVPGASSKKDKKANKGKKKPFLTAGISGRVMVDYTKARADNADFDINGFELRRADLGVDGRLGKRVRYEISGRVLDTGSVGLLDANIEWRPKGTDLRFRAGQFKTPMSLDETTSSRFTSTLERAAFTDAVDIGRRLGVGVSHTGKKHSFSAGVFGGEIEHQPFTSGIAYAARATYTPIKKKRQIVHIGTSVRYSTDNKDQGQIRYRQRPYTHIADRIISTGRIAESDLVVGTEAAIIKNKFWAAGEYSAIYASCSTCANNPNFNGYYAEAGMFFGGRKTYGGGRFGRPRVYKPINKGGIGAFSVVARYDKLDLNDGDLRGGDLGTAIIGADWYPTRNTRLGINYFNGNANLGNQGSGLGVEFDNLRRSGVTSEKVNGFVIRAQYDF